MLALLVTLLGATPDAGLPDCGPCIVVASPRAALAQVLARDPLILGVGEYHELKGAPKVPSALKRFTRELLPALRGRISSLVAETWMMSGRCGEVEKQANTAVEKTTKRPETTEDELTTLLDRTYRLGVKNHVLIINCDDYRSMLDDAGELDPEASLLLVKRKVEEKAVEALEKGEASGKGQLLVLYGGALHNDLEPLPKWRDFAFGQALSRETGGRYVELDLLVPEYVEDEEDLIKEPWFAGAMARARAGRTVLVMPHRDVFLLIFPRAKRR